MENNRPLGWTTLEEAKKLVEAGLDPNTADMSYNFVVCKVVNGNASEDWLLQPFPPDENQPHKQLPCWSLGALKNIVEEEFGKDFSYENSEWVIIVWSDLSGYKHFYFEEIVNCVLWLLENGYIKKHE